MGKFYAQLSIEERTMIRTQLSMGVKAAVVARDLGRSASTLSRELHRNGWTCPKVPRGPGRRGRGAIALTRRMSEPVLVPLRHGWSDGCVRAANCGMRFCLI